MKTKETGPVNRNIKTEHYRVPGTGHHQRMTPRWHPSHEQPLIQISGIGLTSQRGPRALGTPLALRMLTEIERFITIPYNTGSVDCRGQWIRAASEGHC